MPTVSDFEDLEIWQLSRKQAQEIFTVLSIEEFSNDFPLKNQLNASSGSVMDNIAEGFERSGNKEFLNFLHISKASNGEVRSQLHRAFDRKYITQELYELMIENNKILGSKIMNFIKYLKGSEIKGFRYK